MACKTPFAIIIRFMKNYYYNFSVICCRWFFSLYGFWLRRSRNGFASLLLDCDKFNDGILIRCSDLMYGLTRYRCHIFYAAILICTRQFNFWYRFIL